MPVKEIIKLYEKWRRPKHAAVMARKVQVELKHGEAPLDLEKTTGNVRTTKKVTVQPLETI